jgi:serine/threonine-protein kinase
MVDTPDIGRNPLKAPPEGLGETGVYSGEEVSRLLSGLPGPGAAPAAAPPAADKPAGDPLVLGNYEVLERLGAGGMGTVFKARHRRMKRIVALKVLSQHIAQDATFLQRFQREVETVARLAHPNIVMAYDADESEAGPYLVMEFVNGRDLASKVQEQGPMSLRSAVEAILQAARGLAYAHGQGLIHRDIKPANLLLDADGTIKVADMGLARFQSTPGQAGSGVNSLTQAGSVVGTADYMAPEQALDSTTIDHRADVYSLGCTLYFLLSGNPPYPGTTLMATLLKHRDAPIPSLDAVRPGTPTALDALLRRMLAKTPETRCQSMTEVVQGLEKVLSSLSGAGMAISGPLPAVGRPVTMIHTPTGTTMAGQVPTADTDAGAPAAGKPRLPVTVLLAEPSRTQAAIVRKFLQDLGVADVQTAPSGVKALESFQAKRPDVIICSMHLADVRTPDLIRQLRAQAAGAPLGVVLISSETDTLEPATLKDLGDAVLLRKPFDLPRLEQAIRQAAGLKKDRAEAKVLLVDDSTAARLMMRRVLENQGIKHVTEAANGARALDLIAQNSFDLIVSDYIMGGMDGRELTVKVRQRSAVPILLVTAEQDPARLDELRQAGVTAFCDKNCRPEALAEILGRLL